MMKSEGCVFTWLRLRMGTLEESLLALSDLQLMFFLIATIVISSHTLLFMMDHGWRLAKVYAWIKTKIKGA